MATGSLGCFRLEGRLEGSLRFLTAPATTDQSITCHPGPFGALLNMILRPDFIGCSRYLTQWKTHSRQHGDVCTMHCIA